MRCVEKSCKRAKGMIQHEKVCLGDVEIFLRCV